VKNSLLLGLGRYLVPVPRMIWQSQVSGSAKQTESSLGFMSQEHHLIRNFVVRELPRVGKPLTPEFIAQELDIPVERVVPILDELEKNMTFLFRGKEGAVTWAYPVTVDVTPHHITFGSGEQIYAA
jgi:hypothetical protein